MTAPSGAIAKVTLLVEDLDVAITFFTAAMGFVLVEDLELPSSAGAPKRWVVVAPARGGTALVLALPTSDAQRAALGRQAGDRVGLFYEVEDFASSYAHMESASVHFCEEPRDEPYGTVAVFEDCVGNRWDLLGPARGASA